MGSRTLFVVERKPMAGPSQIVAVVAAGGALGFLIWKMRSPAAAPPPTDPCAGLTGDALAACKAAGLLVTLGGAVAGEVASLAGPEDFQQFDDERNRRRDNNNKLNGAPVATPLSGDVTGDQHGPYSSNWTDDNATPSGPYRYANGCEPYYAAPGWSKCAAGTLDMYEMAVQQGVDTSSWRSFGASAHVLNEDRVRVWSVFETPADLATATDKNQGLHPFEKLVKDNYGTGASGDPLTQGPWVDGNGAIWWLVRGNRFAAPAGQVPLAIAMRARGPLHTGDTQATVDAAIKALTDAQAVSLIPVGSYGRSSGTGTTTNYTGCAAIVANPNLTWDPVTSSWKRLSAGKQRNLGPCAPTVTHSKGHATEINVLGDLYGIGAP